MPPIVCGIVNATPDSFFDGGRYKSLIDHAKRLIDAGADWIDIGGESTRPGADLVEAQEELDRVLPLVEALSQLVPISIDTTKGAVARAAHNAGATIINDVRGFQDEDMQEASKLFEIGIVMHSKGRPQTMQSLAQYDNIVDDVCTWLLEQSNKCHAKNILLDPGIGFAKELRHNQALMKHLHKLTTLGHPIMLGTSRKSFIGQVLNQPNADDRLVGSLATVAAGWYSGVQAFRVHDVQETKDLLTMLEFLK